jgi:hypothetical protein
MNYFSKTDSGSLAPSAAPSPTMSLARLATFVLFLFLVLGCLLCGFAQEPYSYLNAAHCLFGVDFMNHSSLLSLTLSAIAAPTP